MKKKSNQITPSIYVHDIHVGAYLQLKGLEPKLQKEGTRVVFCFPNSPDTQILMNDYYGNPTVKIIDFVSSLRRLRGRMLSMRG